MLKWKFETPEVFKKTNEKDKFYLKLFYMATILIAESNFFLFFVTKNLNYIRRLFFLEKILCRKLLHKFSIFFIIIWYGLNLLFATRTFILETNCWSLTPFCGGKKIFNLKKQNFLKIIFRILSNSTYMRLRNLTNKIFDSRKK